MSVQALANSILKKAFREQIPVTPMKLQKLIYFIYRDYLQKCNKPPFTEQFETWQYGPVLPSVYDEFKSFGSNKITKFAKDAQGDVYIVNESTSPALTHSINTVWNKYKAYNGIALSQITHKDGSAWSKAFESGELTLDVKDIMNDRTE